MQNPNVLPEPKVRSRQVEEEIQGSSAVRDDSTTELYRYCSTHCRHLARTLPSKTRITFSELGSYKASDGDSP
jgi:hypothetical protein